MKNRVHFSSEKHNWKTPKKLLQDVLLWFDRAHFNIDVCSSKSNVPARHFFTPKENGLLQEWRGLCWMNPPYGREIEQWIRKARTSRSATVVCLVPARTDTKWWHEHIVSAASVILFLRGRVRFEGAPASAPFPSAIVVFGKVRKKTITRIKCSTLSGWGIFRTEQWKKR